MFILITVKIKQMQHHWNYINETWFSEENAILIHLTEVC